DGGSGNRNLGSVPSARPSMRSFNASWITAKILSGSGGSGGRGGGSGGGSGAFRARSLFETFVVALIGCSAACASRRNVLAMLSSPVECVHARDYNAGQPSCACRASRRWAREVHPYERTRRQLMNEP